VAGKTIGYQSKNSIQHVTQVPIDKMLRIYDAEKYFVRSW